MQKTVPNARSFLPRAWLLLASLALASCAAAPSQRPGPGPVDLPVDGTYFHVVTRVEFPETVGPFTRTRVTRYDPGAFNVSGSYRLTGTVRGVATVYHYPATDDGSPPTAEEVQQHFESVKQDVLRETPELQLVEESPYGTRINGVALRGGKALFRAPQLHGSPGPVDSAAYLFVLGGWYLKFRFTYPLDSAAALEPLQEEFISSMRWVVP